MSLMTETAADCPTAATVQHEHGFGQGQKRRAELRTLQVTLLTIATMFAEIIGGWVTGSMALLADGVHMGGHALALGLATAAYYLSRRFATDRCLTLGSGKINDLMAYTSALLLGLSCIWLTVESVTRLMSVQPLLAKEALLVAIIGLVVNLLSAWLLAGRHEHLGSHQHGHHSHDHHDHSYHNYHGHDHHAHHHGRDHATDNNLRAALLHVIADAVTSVAAIIGLIGAWLWGWYWLDPVIALVATVMVLRWAVILLRQTAGILLDVEGPQELRGQIQARLESINGTQIRDCHLWSVGQGAWTLVASVVAHHSVTPEHYKAKLAGLEGLHHPIIEVYHCEQCGDQVP